MCGIFGFVLHSYVQLKDVFEVLQKLEVQQYPDETRPVGGYGAGLAVIQDHSVICDKLGKESDSPAEQLSRMFTIQEANVLLGHVRMPSPQFMNEARYRQTSQPYVADCRENLKVLSVHNGFISNFKELKKQLGRAHRFESERVGLVDSEIVAHLFEEILEKYDSSNALNELFSALEGSSTIAILEIWEDQRYLHLMHKGITRGLDVWSNRQDEILFCSRQEALNSEFKNLLARRDFRKLVSIPHGTEAKWTRRFIL